MSNFEKFKDIAGSVFEKGKELGGAAIEKGGKAIGEAKLNLEISSLKKEIEMSKIKLGDLVYQLNIETGNDEIEKLKKLIGSSLEELKYLESKKSK